MGRLYRRARSRIIAANTVTRRRRTAPHAGPAAFFVLVAPAHMRRYDHRGIFMAYKVAVLTNAGDAAHAARVCEALEKAGHAAVACTCDAALARTLRAERPDAAAIALGAADAALDEAARELLDLLGIPYLGSTAPVCRAVRDRARLGDVLAAAFARGELDAPAAATVALSKTCVSALGARDALDLLAERIPGGLPVAVAPLRGGSAVSAATPEELSGALAQALEGCMGAVVQERLEGVRLCVGILGDADDLQVLPAVELDGDRRHVPVRLASLAADESDAQAIRSEVERAALDAYFDCACRDLALVEVVWDGARARVVSVDPAPSLAEGSLLDAAVAAAGFDLTEMLDALVCCVVERG